MKNELKIFCGNSNPELAKKICRNLGIKLGKCEIIKFSNENIKVRILESVRGKDVYVVQSSCPPVNENIMELLIMIDAIKHAKADSITAVLPYYPYARSDKKDEPRISITARLIADLLETAGARPRDDHEPSFAADRGLLPDPGGPPARRKTHLQILQGKSGH